MNKNLNSVNLEDVQKLTKYQVRLLNMGGGGSSEQKNVYKAKINEYGQRLSKSGVNVDRLINVIQRGGNPLEDLKKQQEEAEKALAELEAINDDNLITKMEEIQRNAEAVNKLYYELAVSSKDSASKLAQQQQEIAQKDQEIAQRDQEIAQKQKTIDDNKKLHDDYKVASETQIAASAEALKQIKSRQDTLITKRKAHVAGLTDVVAKADQNADIMNPNDLMFYLFASKMKELNADTSPDKETKMNGEIKEIKTWIIKQQEKDSSKTTDDLIAELMNSKHYIKLSKAEKDFAHDQILMPAK